MVRAMAELGHTGVGVPQPINLFMNVPILPDGRLGWEPAASGPGDAVTLRAEIDALVVVSACPQDVGPTNDHKPTRIGLELLD